MFTCLKQFFSISVCFSLCFKASCIQDVTYGHKCDGGDQEGMCGVFYNYLAGDINFLPFLSISIIISVFIAHLVINIFIIYFIHLYSKIEDLLWFTDWCIFNAFIQYLEGVGVQ